MSACAVMLVKDEADVIEHVLRHLAYHVDEILVADNGSTDGTRELLAEIELPVALNVADDDEVGYYQSRKTTALAMEALALGHSWVVPCDADEVWYVSAEPERRIADFLDGLAPDVQIVEASLFHHIPTAVDPRPSLPDGVVTSTVGESNPFRRIGWRKREHGGLPKVACRLRPDLVILPGNHGAATSGTGARAGGLCVRHFSWRSEGQYVRKIRNGAIAYAASDLPADTGVHWRMHGSPDAADFDERVGAHFRSWFFSPNPKADPSLTYDPAPVAG